MKWTILNNVYRKITEIHKMLEQNNVVYFTRPHRQWFLKNEEIILVQEDIEEITTIKAIVIGSYKKGDTIIVQCEILDKQVHINKRRHYRQYCEYEATFTTAYGLDEGIILDISYEGCKLETNLDLLRQGDILEIHFYINDELISIRAIVQWVKAENKNTYCGLKFYYPLKKAL
jgi:hypothetical protein